MNDFTKEELNHIYKLFDLIKLAYPSLLLDENLKDKIQSLIDAPDCSHD